MVKATVDEFQRNNFAGTVHSMWKGTDICSLAIPAEPGIRKSQQIARPFEVTGLVQRQNIEAPRTKPLFEIHLLVAAPENGTDLTKARRPTTTPAFAVNTKSGSPSTGGMRSIPAPTSRSSTCINACH